MLKDIIKDLKMRLILAGSMTILTLLVFLYLADYKSIAMGLGILALALLFFNGVVLYIRTKVVNRTYIKNVIASLLVLWNVLIAFCTTVFIIADAMFFYPNQDDEAYQKNKQNAMLEEVKIVEDGASISGWFGKNAEGKAPLVIYFGGNGECSARRFDNLETYQIWDTFEGYNFLMADYLGYGLSAGKPSDKAMFAMAKRVYDYAITREDVDPDQIVVMGYSLGTGVATYLSSQREVSGLILMAPYDEGLSLYNSKMNIFKGPLKLLATNHYDSKKYAEKVTVSPIILASKDDEMIPYSLSVELSKHFQINPQLITFDGFYHNDFWEKDEVFTEIKAYLQEVDQ